MYLLLWRVGLLVLCSAVVLVGCGGKNTNPVGAELVNRKDLGGVVRLKPILPSRKVTEFRGIRPTRNGTMPSLVAGSLNRIEVTALLRFVLPTDALLTASGGKDVSVVRAKVQLFRRPTESVGEPRYTVWQTLSGWDEQSGFVNADTTREAPVSLGRLDSVRVTEEADITTIDLSPSFVRSRLRLSGRAAGEPDTVDIALQAAAGAQFMTSWVALDDSSVVSNKRPSMDLTIRVPGDSLRTLTIFSTADTFYGVRQGAGPDSASLTVGTGLRYWTYMTFTLPTQLNGYTLPDSLPKRATINSARLEVEVAQPGSFPADVGLAVDRLIINPTTRDSSIAQGALTGVRAGDAAVSIEIGPLIVQAWTSGQASNDGIILLPVGGADLLSWVALRNPRLTVVYSLPPGTE